MHHESLVKSLSKSQTTTTAISLEPQSALNPGASLDFQVISGSIALNWGVSFRDMKDILLQVNEGDRVSIKL